MLKIEARQWVAIWYRCPKCGAQSGETMLTPWQYSHRPVRACHSYKHDRCSLEIVEHRWYTTFCIEPGVSFTTIAGTLATIGPFKLCDIVQPNIRAFRRWYRRRRAEEDEKARQYREREHQIEAEWKARRERQRQEAALLQEAEAVARSVWPVASQPTRQAEDGFDPFLDYDPDELP